MAPHHKPKKNINATGRSKYDNSQHLRLYHTMLKSPQFRALNGNDVRVLLEIASRHNGFNNGRLGAGLADLANTLMMGKTTVQNSLARLQKTRFIKKQKAGKFYGRLATEWAVTFISDEGKPASNEWGQAPALSRKRRPKEKTIIEQTREEIEKQAIKI